MKLSSNTNEKADVIVFGSSGLAGSGIVVALSEHQELTVKTDCDLFFSLDYTETSILSVIRSGLKKHLKEGGYVVIASGLVGGIEMNNNRPDYMHYYNSLMGMNLLKVCEEVGVKNLIYLSSSCAYPVGAPKPLDESDIYIGEPEKTNYGYAIAKRSVMQYCKSINRLGPDFNYYSVVPCNLYGVNDRYYPVSKAHVIPALISKIHTAKLSSQSELQMLGTGIVKREFMSSSELGRIITYLIEEAFNIRVFQDQINPEVLNVGSGNEITIKDLAEAIRDEIYPDLHLIFEMAIKTEKEFRKIEMDGVNSKVMNMMRVIKFMQANEHISSLSETSRNNEGQEFTSHRTTPELLRDYQNYFSIKPVEKNLTGQIQDFVYRRAYNESDGRFIKRKE